MISSSHGTLQPPSCRPASPRLAKIALSNPGRRAPFRRDLSTINTYVRSAYMHTHTSPQNPGSISRRHVCTGPVTQFPELRTQGMHILIRAFHDDDEVKGYGQIYGLPGGPGAPRPKVRGLNAPGFTGNGQTEYGRKVRKHFSWIIRLQNPRENAKETRETDESQWRADNGIPLKTTLFSRRERTFNGHLPSNATNTH